MSRQYAPKAFFRHVPFTLLRQFFDRLGIAPNVDWDRLEDGDADAMFDAWQALASADRELAEMVFRQVHDLATRDGTRTLVQEGQFIGRDFAAELEPVEGHYAKALWVFLNDPLAFHSGWQIYHAETLPGRYWRRKTGYTNRPPDLSHDALSSFRTAVSEYFRREQGRGHRCSADPYNRDYRGAYLFVYPDDYTQTYVGHDLHGRLRRNAQRPAFEIVFHFHPPSGVLDLYAPGDRHLKDTLEGMLCEHVLRQPAPPERLDRPPYVLTPLKHRGFLFRTDPEDGIRLVRIRSMRLSLPDNPQRVTLDAAPDGPADEIYDMLDRWLNPMNIPLSALNISQVTLQIRHTPKGETRERTLTFDVTYPSGCNLKSRAEDQRELGEKYLRAWGIAHA